MDVENQTGGRTITVRIVDNQTVASCLFWIGLFKRGKTSAREINSLRKIDDILSKAATEGIDENEPLMLSEANSMPARYVYLLPKHQNTAKKTGDIAPDLITVLKSWKATDVGLYLAPELLADEGDLSLAGLLADFIDAEVSENLYLYVGAQGLNYVINQAIDAKLRVASDRLHFFIYH